VTVSPQLQAYRFDPAIVTNLGPSLIRFDEVWSLPEINDLVETDAYLSSMRLINVEAFLEREYLMKDGKPVDHRKNVLEFADDEETKYAILSHRWMKREVEVDYGEMVKLAKMAVAQRDEIRQREGYQKILQSCKQGQSDGYEWLWVDTCCIDKRCSAELSEAINSMYRWYENAEVCYAYLHDVPASSFPTVEDWERYPKFNGWPEWFSRGWTLQELIAPSNVQFFNKDWHSIGDKRTLAPTLWQKITRIPEHILVHGLRGNRPCVAQIMSWAAYRTTTRVEDRAYSLMGLLDVNMPMLYGEGKKAFHRLQLEIIRASNDQSIFAWDTYYIQQPCSILADDPSEFESCDRMELMGHDEFIQYVKEDIPEEELDSIEDRLGAFPVTNRGIQIWMLLRPHPGSRTLFQAWLPCRRGRWDPRPVTIHLALWESNYYASPFFVPLANEAPKWELRQVYLRYQDPPHRNITFEIDDSALTENGFTCCDAYPKKFTGDTLTLTTTDPLCVKVYSDSSTKHLFVTVGLGQSFGKDWIHVVSDASNIIPPSSWDTEHKYFKMLFRAPEHAQAMNKTRSGSESYGQVCIMQIRLPQTNSILQTSSVMWKSSRMCRVKLDVFHDPGFGDVSSEWRAFDVDVGIIFCTSRWH